MCLLIHRPIGAIVPASHFANAIENNPDGWGIMASDGKKIISRKGMTVDGFSKSIERFDGLDTFIHFRYATHGLKDKSNCHPFPIADGKFAVMHNGVIAVDCKSNPERSDTWHYANGILAPMLAKDPEAILDPKFVGMLGRHVGVGNKIAILRSNGEHAILNRSEGFEIDGVWYSNKYSMMKPYDCWNDFIDIDDLSKMTREEIIEACDVDPEMIADAILEYGSRWNRWKDYR